MLGSQGGSSKELECSEKALERTSNQTYLSTCAMPLFSVPSPSAMATAAPFADELFHTASSLNRVLPQLPHWLPFSLLLPSSLLFAHNNPGYVTVSLLNHSLFALRMKVPHDLAPARVSALSHSFPA